MDMVGLNALNMVSATTRSSDGPNTALATRVFAQMGDQLLQHAGEQWGVPQAQIDAQRHHLGSHAGEAHGSRHDLDQAIADLGHETKAALTEIGDAQRKAQQDLRDLLNDLAKDHKTKEAKEGGGHRAVGWLEAMAEALGRKLDALAHDMQDLAGKVNKEDPSTSTNFTVASQEFNMLMEASSTALKTIGESMGKMASRQ